MATYEFAVTSAGNEFKVKDKEEVLQVISSLGYEESEIYNDNSLFIGSYEKTIDDDNVIIEKSTNKPVAVEVNSEYYELNEDETETDLINDIINDNGSKYEIIVWHEYLQRKLLDNKQVAVITEAGNEKLRYAGSYTIIISKDGIFENSSQRFIQDTLTKLNIK